MRSHIRADMELSVNIDNLFARYDLEQSAAIYREAGMSAVDYNLDEMVKKPASAFNTDGYRAEAERVRKIINDSGLVINQTHAPFHFRDWDNKEHYESVIYPTILRSIEISALLGAGIAVVHPLHYREYHGHEKEIFELNMDFYRSLIPFCREWGIKVGIENMWQRDARRNNIIFDTCGTKEEFVRYIDTLDSEYMVATLDIGHVGLPQGDDEAWDLIRALGHDRLKSLHVHDNDYRSDMHALPFHGSIDWSKVTEALGEIDYDGDFTYEVKFHGNAPDGFIRTTAKYMADVGRYLIGEIDSHRQRSI